MPHYRVTIRFGGARQRYEMLDLTAASLREAMHMAADRYPDAATDDADLVEIRRQKQPEERELTPGE